MDDNDRTDVAGAESTVNDSFGVLRDHLLARVERTTENTLAPGSKRSYAGSIARYLSWLYTTGETLLNKRLLSPEFRLGVVGEGPTAAYTRTFLAQKPRVPPLVFSEFRGSDFTLWLASLQDQAEKDNGKPLKPSTLGGHRSALRYLFSEYHLNLDDYTDKLYDNFFTGLKRDTAGLQGGGIGKALVGKLPLSFKAYVALGGCFLGSGNSEDVFAHFFLTLQWNLMCRSASTAAVCFSHVTWRGDAMGIVFPRMKNDQAGERPREPRHVFANPIEPTICPILSAAMYFLCFPSINGHRFFPGDNQPERFRKRLHVVTGAVHERYCQYESAGDQHVGRTASGLPVDTPDFAALPPHFATIDDTVLDATKAVFPALHRVSPALVSFCLASLVYHDGFLAGVLPPNHPVLQSHYYKNNAMKQTLTPLVSQAHAPQGPVESLRPTGVPPHVNLLVQMNTLAGELRELVAAVRAMPDAIATTMEARELQSDGPVMRSELRGLMQAVENVNKNLEALQSRPLQAEAATGV